MCIRKKLIANKKYIINKKNGGEIPVCNDERQKYVWVPCGQCYICRKKKAREWRMRITEDIKVNNNAKIVTLTFNTESLKKLANEIKGISGYDLDNEICKLAVKRWRERWRKKYGRSPRHWLITELGHGKTEHVHMHGIIWQDKRYTLENELLNEIEKTWGYGYIGKGKIDYETGKIINYVNARTANYFTKYVNKIDELHKEYKQIILTSPGIGSAYVESNKAKDNIYKGEQTNQMYNIDTGGVLPMPTYFRQKLYTEEEREKLTTDMLNKKIIYIEGKEYRADIGDDKINLMYKALQDKNARMGYGDGSKNYERKRLENVKRKKLHLKRFLEGSQGPKKNTAVKMPPAARVWPRESREHNLWKSAIKPSKDWD